MTNRTAPPTTKVKSQINRQKVVWWTCLLCAYLFARSGWPAVESFTRIFWYYARTVYTHTRTRTHAHTDTHIHIHTYTHTDTHIHAHTRGYTHSRAAQMFIKHSHRYYEIAIQNSHQSPIDTWLVHPISTLDACRKWIRRVFVPKNVDENTHKNEICRTRTEVIRSFNLLMRVNCQ